AVVYEPVEEREEGIELPRGVLVVEILDVRRRDPEETRGGRNQVVEQRLMNFFVENKAIHRRTFNIEPSTLNVQSWMLNVRRNRRVRCGSPVRRPRRSLRERPRRGWGGRGWSLRFLRRLPPGSSRG